MVADARTPPLWLGLDLSTQSLTLVLLPDEPGGAHVYLDSISYAEDLPQYNTEHGMHISDGDDGEKVCGTRNTCQGTSREQAPSTKNGVPVLIVCRLVL